MIIDVFPKHLSTLNNGAVVNTVVDHPRAGPCWIVGGDIFNGGGAVAYLQVFNVAAAGVTLGTTVPVYTRAIPAGGSVPIDPPRPLLCSTALSYAVTATRLGAGAAAASMCLLYA